jgi:hypothetical protein
MALAHTLCHHADRCPVGAQHVFRAARKGSAQPPATQRMHGLPHELPLVAECIRVLRLLRAMSMSVLLLTSSTLLLFFWLTADVFWHAGHSAISRSKVCPSHRPFYQCRTTFICLLFRYKTIEIAHRRILGRTRPTCWLIANMLRTDDTVLRLPRALAELTRFRSGGVSLVLDSRLAAAYLPLCDHFAHCICL